MPEVPLHHLFIFVFNMRKNIYYYLQIYLFLIVISSSVFGYLKGVNSRFTLTENRSLAQKPILKIQNLKTFPKLYSDFFNDHFGFRPLLVQLGNIIQVKLFKSSPNNLVTIGKDDWFFYNSEDTYLDSLHAHPFTDDELLKVKTNLVNAKEHWATQGAKFVFLIAPKAQTVYPELLPSYLKSSNGLSQREQIKKYLQGSNISIIDPTESLTLAKSLGQVYYKYDTHWNQLGAWVVYQQLLKSLSTDFPSLQPTPLEDFTVSYADNPRKDLAVLVGGETFLHEEEPMLKLKSGEKALDIVSPCPNLYFQCPKIVKAIQGQGTPKALFLRDSFLTNVIPFLSEHFSESTYLWGIAPYSLQDFESTRPDVVIYELTERDLWRLLTPVFE